MPTIVFTGGGSAGHVTPNIALIEKFQQNAWQIAYVGSYQGIERQLITQRGIDYHAVSSGKLRRYFSWQNFIDPLKIVYGILQCWLLLGKIKPNVIFSKGGFVAVPVVVAAKLKKIPVIAHESDFTPGLANKLSFPFVSKICITFPDTKKFLKANNKVVMAGTPIRQQFFAGNSANGKAYCGFNNEKKNILVMGGGSGSEIINETLRNALSQLLPNFNIIHICGLGKMIQQENRSGYVQFEYLHDELFDVMAAADIVISRSGANSLYELIALKKLHILIPLSKKASRGDQIVNAEYFLKKGVSKIIYEENLTPQTLVGAVNEVEKNSAQYRQAREQVEYSDGTETIYNLLLSEAK